MRKSPADVMRARNQTRPSCGTRCYATTPPKRKRPAFAGLDVYTADESAMAVMTMAGVMAAAPVRHRGQFEIGNPRRDVEPGLALHADRLQRVGIGRTTDQKIAAATDTDRRVGADAAVIAA